MSNNFSRKSQQVQTFLYFEVFPLLLPGSIAGSSSLFPSFFCCMLLQYTQTHFDMISSGGTVYILLIEQIDLLEFYLHCTVHNVTRKHYLYSSSQILTLCKSKLSSVVENAIFFKSLSNAKYLLSYLRMYLLLALSECMICNTKFVKLC